MDAASSSPIPPLTDVIVAAVSRLVDDHAQTREPSHSAIESLIDRAGLRHRVVTTDELQARLHHDDDSDGLLPEFLGRASYYDAASFTDVVLRVGRHLGAHADDIPTYPLVVVDEYQDFSSVETRLIDLLAQRSPVLIAGDDDQALYEFKHASAQYIRTLASDPAYAQFTLPYCSRCPEVLVEAVNSVVRAAQAAGLLQERLDKPFRCYMPGKAGDSAAHPKIIFANCTVESKAAAYMSRYVGSQIAEIPAEDIAESHRLPGYPTALVIGPRHYLERVHAFLTTHGYPQAKLKSSAPRAVDILDGYKRLRDDECSRLGWRIVVESDPPGDDSLVRRIVAADRLDQALPGRYRDKHLGAVAVLQLLQGEGVLTAAKVRQVSEDLGVDGSALIARLRLGWPSDDVEADVQTNEVPKDPALPSIVCTSIIGSKGLSAGYVYVLGMNNGDLPRSRIAVTDAEACQFIVALSRARKECQLVGVGRFAGQPTNGPSVFVDWIRPHVQTRWINAAYWARMTPRPS